MRISLASCDEDEVYFHPLPKKYWEIWEKSADVILEHEHIHLVLLKIADKETSKKFDKLCDWLKKKGKPNVE